MYEILSGPLFLASIIVSLLGISIKVFQLIKLTESKKYIKSNNSGIGNRSKKSNLIMQKTIKNSFFWKDPVLFILTCLFHILILTVPFFLLSHNILFYQYFKFELFALPEYITDISTLITIFLATLLFLRRIFLEKVRVISSGTDFILIIICMIPFLTGYFAYHQIFNYKFFMMLHIISGELLIVAIGWTKLSHFIFFIFARFFIRGEFNIGVGIRTWKV